MKFKILFFIFIIFFINSNSITEEIEIISDNINIFDDGNLIKSTNSKAFLKKKKLSLESDKSLYNKKKEEISLEDNVFFFDEIQNIEISTKKALYNQKRDILKTIGLTNINFNNKYKIVSGDMVYNRISQKIYSNSETRIEDFEGNIYTVQDNFNLDLDKEIISTKKLM